ncbi:MAG: CDP-diacylglycerol--glycerol-3-phosphate 3-phosphatidyltransferase [Nitrospiria bacterium]
MNLPNILTTFRIMLIPFYIVVFQNISFRSSVLAAAIFLVAALTDILDGYLARARLEVTKLGKFLDPIADKLLVVSALILLVSHQRVPAWLVIVIIGREFAVTGFRAIAASEGVVISAENTGKYKMIFQTISVIILTIDFKDPIFHNIGLLLLMISMILAVFSACQYFYKFGRTINLLGAK